MSDFLKKIKDQYAKIKTTHSSYIKNGIRPNHDWAVLLIVASISIFILAILAFYFYILVDQGVLFSLSVDNSQKEVKINATVLKKVVDDINTREANLNKTNQNQITEPDPSL